MVKPPANVTVHGIDEAGYGPLLGPLVVARADFSCAAEARLSRVGRKSKRIRVGDSKRILAGADGRATLEATVLGFHAAVHGRAPRTLAEWLANDSSGGLLERLEELPWYRELEVALPFAADPDDVERAAEDVRAGKVLKGGEFVGLSLRVLDEATLNRDLCRTDNKHETLFGEVARLMEEPLSAGSRHRFEVDRLGGRTRYADKLSLAFPFAPVTVLEEASKRSSYDIEYAGAQARVSFSVSADDRHPECALASMCAKYTREALMRVFNRYWQDRAPTLRPTAGYYSDGRRFLDDLEALKLMGAGDRERLTRQR